MEAMSTREQLRHLKGMTMRLGQIHEAQVLQLRNYPLLLPNIKRASTKIDHETRSIIYDCESKTGKHRKSKKFTAMVENIIIWTRSIVWDDTAVEVKIDGKVVYDTRNPDR